MIEVDSLLWKDGVSNVVVSNVYTQKLGLKRYELSNHLGNVSTVITDRKLVDSNSGSSITAYKADVVSVSDYYPFGMKITERSWSSDSYRFGFNGKDFFSDWNRQDYGFRIYDPRKCRFESVDPLHGEYPELTTYQFASNRCIDGIDLDGREYDPKAQANLMESSTTRQKTTPYLHQNNNLIWPKVKPTDYTVHKVLTTGGIILVCTYLHIPVPITASFVSANLASWDGKTNKQIFAAGVGGFLGGSIPVVGQITGKWLPESQILQVPVFEFIKNFGLGGLSAAGGNISEQYVNIFLGSHQSQVNRGKAELDKGELMSNLFIGTTVNGVFGLINVNLEAQTPRKFDFGLKDPSKAPVVPGVKYLFTRELLSEESSNMSKGFFESQINTVLEVGQDSYKSKLTNSINNSSNGGTKKD